MDTAALVFARTRGHAPAFERLAAAYSRAGEHAACWIALQVFRDRRLAAGCAETFLVAGSARFCQPWASDGAAAVTSAICWELMGWVVLWWVVA